jgi:hypothetical protein
LYGVTQFYTLAHRADETGKTFVCAEHFGKLSASGWTDMWRQHNPGTTEWTWYSKLKGGARENGFRLDHCFATPSLAPRITSCRYSHMEPRSDIGSLVPDCGTRPLTAVAEPRVMPSPRLTIGLVAVIA